MDQAARNNYKFICFTEEGKNLMNRIISLLPGDGGATEQGELPSGSLSEWAGENFKTGNVLVFIGALGIAVRAISPFVSDKTRDAAVIVIDEKGEFVIPVLSGHLGGAVDAAKKIADLIGAKPVITTATDVRGEFAVDVFAKDNSLSISDMKKAKAFSAYLLKNGRAYYRVDPDFADVIEVAVNRENVTEDSRDDEGSFTISPKVPEDNKLTLIPKCIVIGIGCRKGKAGAELIEFAKEVMAELSLDMRSVAAVTSIDLKKDEEGIIELSGKLGADFYTYSNEVLMQQEGEFTASDFVRDAVGADNVCERSLMAYGCQRIVMKKRAKNGMTLAIGAIRRKLYYE